MPRPVKLAVTLFLVTLGLVLAVALYLIISFDPNNYRAEISARVQAETGRSLTLQDDIELQLFPWIGLKLGTTRLSGPANFSAPSFITVRSARIRVKLLPLLQQRLEVDTITLEGLEVNLLTTTDGRNNWDFAPDSAETPAYTEAGSTSQPSATPPATAQTRLRINGLDIRDATLIWEDAASQTRLSLEQLTLSSGPIDLADPDSAIAIDAAFQLSGKPLPEQALAIKLGSRITLDTRQQTVKLARLQLQAGELQLAGNIDASGLDSTPGFSGKLELVPFNPRPLMQQFGMTVPATRDPTALTSVAASLQFAGDGKHLEIRELSVQLDETLLEGQLAATFEPVLASTFTLALGKLDIDRYLPPATGPTSTADNTRSANDPAPATFDLPLEWLRTLNLQGQTRIDTIKAANLRASNIATTISARDGLIRLHPLQADLYQGHTEGTLQLDARPQKPRFLIQQKLAGFQAEPFLRDLLDSARVAGRTDMHLDLSGQGNSLDELTHSLNGKADFRFNDGAVKGLNIADMIRRTQAKLDKRPVPEATTQQTDFTSLSASITINNGVVNNQDLSAQAPFLRISGSGKADLVKEHLDYRLRAKVVEDTQGQGGADLASLRGTEIPIRIRGPLTDPSIKLDSAVIKDKLRRQAGESIKKEIQEKGDDIKSQLQEQARDKLKQKLKKLF